MSVVGGAWRVYAAAACAITLCACSKIAGLGGLTYGEAGAPCSEGTDCTSGLCSMGVCLTPGCTTSADCAGDGENNYFVCRNSQCISLKNDLCQTVHTTKKNDADAYRDDNAVFFGSILSTVGPDADFGTLIEDSAKMAIDDFAAVNGIPSTTPGINRPLVLVGCNDGPNEDHTDAAAKFLTQELGIQAILGYDFSGNTELIATDVTINDGVLLFSPSATSDEITNLKDNDLVWRTCPPDTLQATALSQYYAEVEVSARQRYTIAPNQIKVAILTNNDLYGLGLGDRLEPLLMFNGASAASQQGTFYRRFNYGSGSSIANVVSQVVGFAPHIIFLFGFNEGPDQVMTQIEKDWVTPADQHRPMWVFSDGGEDGTLWMDDIKSTDLRTRITGSTPGVSVDWAPYATFRSQWLSSQYSMGGTVTPDQLGPAGAYDIIYMFAYSAIAVGNAPLTGQNLVQHGLRRMVPGPGIPKFTIGRTHISEPFELLGQGKPIDIEGTSGPLDFDQDGMKHGEAISDVQIWCVPPGTSGHVADPAIYSGRFYASASNTMAGSFSPACALP